MKLCDSINQEMDHLAKTSLLLKLTSIFFISSASADPTNITAELGQNIILPCRAPDSRPVIGVEWDRTDLGEYVLLYRNNQFDLEHQHPSFKDRVDLQKEQIMVGDVSLVLKNVSTDDRGTYECLVSQSGTNRQIALYINLDVVPPPGEPDDGSKDGSDGWRVHLVVGLAACLLLVAAIFFAIVLYFKRKKKSNSNQPPGAAAGNQQSLMSPPDSAEQ
ncbi:immunoglobulin superfamily member 11-like [Fundulus heteroclitus]|uniref:immunoglobulin superfamily member 11-like n=1 Tax=Fundulus heteroclitus TaxID=8078 RepID=UPI00165B12F9|nr:immunoglobulin superfamily member 11-like [Fundulus heteroclitus]